MVVTTSDPAGAPTSNGITHIASTGATAGMAFMWLGTAAVADPAGASSNSSMGAKRD
ncbi:hypothetical protein PC122_g9054 [Phytophthora cactorum]|nr:hypothetical protein PC122_g9054 [Phytophthora cactorum]